MTPRLAALAMVGAVAIFGSNFALSRLATLDGLTPSDLTALRFGTAGLILLPLFLRDGVSDCAGVGWGRGILLAITSGAPMSLLMNTGISLSPAAHGATLAPGTVTVTGVVCGLCLYGIVPSRTVLCGMAVVVAGLVCIGFAGTMSGSRDVILGDGLFVLAGAIWGIYPFLVQRWRVSASASTTIVSVLSLVYLPVYALLLAPRIPHVSFGIVAFHAFNQGILNVIVALWLWGSAVRTIGAARAQRFPPLIPVIGTLTAIPVLGEWPGPLQALGLLFIVAGLGVAALASRKAPPTT